MNNNDSDIGQACKPSMVDPAALPGAVPAKASVLRARLAKILAVSGVRTAADDGLPSHFSFGVERVDAALRGNAEADGLPRGALHELHAADKSDRTSAAAIALLMAQRCRFPDRILDPAAGQSEHPILWISESGEARRQGRLYPPGLAELGIDPSAIVHVDAPDSIAALRAAADGVRCSAMGAVIVELAGKKPRGLDLTATRRLSLSSQKSGILSLLLRSGSDPENPLPTAAFSRWQVAAAPSVALAGNAPGHSAFDITLLRHRSGLYGLSARLEWNRDDQVFREQQSEQRTPHPGAVPALAAVRADHPGARAA
ncbi:ImuA family protein [Parasphingorhabdus sp.]|uniref:ImuA family protein n=1 Tax=Parasphingorhabdus sp. TaxID=2709688 RepID=UPI0035941632